MNDNNAPTPPVEPTPPGYDAPASYQPPAPHAYQQPVQNQPPAYQQPLQNQPHAYQQPVQGQQVHQPGADAASNVTLNYWLSVFFSWIPALIFFLTEKGKSSLVDDFNKENLNFSIIRGIVGILWVVVPGIGFIFGLAALALFVMHIIGAVEAPKKLNSGQPYKFPFNFPFIK